MMARTSPEQIIFETDERAYRLPDLQEALAKVGLGPGSEIFLHSDLGHFGRLADLKNRNDYIHAFVDALTETIGEKGSLGLPTFTYSFCRKEIFDLAVTPSTVGIMTEYFRKLPHVQRSLEGIFSVACSGPEAADWVNVGTNCFGKNSIFEKMFSRNVKLVFLGETFDITFMHFIEQRLGVGYRYIKPFPGQILTPNGLQDYVFEYNVRDLEKNVWYDLPKIANHLDQAGVIRKVSLGHSQVRVLRAQDAYAVLKEALGNDERFLLRD